MMETNPQIVEGPAAWYGPSMAESEAWIYRLTASDITEIEAAVDALQQQGTQVRDVNRQNFPLPQLGAKLADIQEEVVNGRGFALIKGLPVEGHSIETSAIAYWGIGAHFGQAVSQNAKGHLLGHVRDIGHDPHDPLQRVFATNYRQPFHTDSCDIVALLCLQPAKTGGLSSMVSSVTLHNEIVKRRPELATVLAQPFYVDRKGEVPAGKQEYYQMPVFNYYADYLTTIYARDFIEGALRFDEVPRLTTEQLEALDMMDELAHSDEIRLDMALEAGDMQFLHNHQTLHARTEYEDYPEPERKRHLLRLWLSPPNGRPLPPVFEERYGNIEVGIRGGIRVPGVEEKVVLEAE